MYLEHVNLTVSNVARSVEFYRTLLGYRVRWEGRTSDGRPAAHVGDDGHYLALFEAASPGRVEPDYGHVGLNHFGFAVEDLNVFRRRARETGFPPHHDLEDEHGHRLYLYDPDGIEIEIVQPHGEA